MNRWWIACVGVVMAMVCNGCSAYVVSGTYVERGQNFVEMIQLTQGQDGNLLGSMISTTLNANGTIAENTFNLSGVANGNSITLIAKPPVSLGTSLNMSGTVDGESITLTTSNGTGSYTRGSPVDYQAAVQQEMGNRVAGTSQIHHRPQSIYRECHLV